jgi:2-C-methyl-D-erythritol 4-phosphate cytidylyltransferase/2-C-methyl-D-erythritol 2,4-cyclodiphosphate synthase
VLVHDGARPFTSPALIDAVLAGLHGAAGIIPALQITDTIKWQDNGVLTQGPKREKLATVQTPQGFDGALLVQAHQKADAFQGTLPVFTDDASIMEWAGHTCRAVAGEQDNIKITTPQDWARAHAILTARGKTAS